MKKTFDDVNVCTLYPPAVVTLPPVAAINPGAEETVIFLLFTLLKEIDLSVTSFIAIR
jgi:hypothetical protein